MKIMLSTFLPTSVATIVHGKTAMELFQQKLKIMTLLRLSFSQGSIVLSQECLHKL